MTTSTRGAGRLAAEAGSREEGAALPTRAGAYVAAPLAAALKCGDGDALARRAPDARVDTAQSRAAAAAARRREPGRSAGRCDGVLAARMDGWSRPVLEPLAARGEATGRRARKKTRRRGGLGRDGALRAGGAVPPRLLAEAKAPSRRSPRLGPRRRTTLANAEMPRRTPATPLLHYWPTPRPPQTTGRAGLRRTAS